MVALDQTPPPILSAPVPLHRKRLAPSLIAPQPAAKVLRPYVDMMDHRDYIDATSSASAFASSASKSGEYGASKKRDKGKGKAKVTYMPELPEEVWRRIFQIHYSDVVDGERPVPTLSNSLSEPFAGP